jgi:hypothetical protein
MGWCGDFGIKHDSELRPKAYRLRPSRKNWNPFTCEPVIALATAVRDLNDRFDMAYSTGFRNLERRLPQLTRVMVAVWEKMGGGSRKKASHEEAG